MNRAGFIQVAALCFSLLHLGGNAAGTESGVSPRSFVVRTWGRAEGLPSEAVTTILQTRDGYLWVGTSAGLVRFDGVRFTSIRLPMSETNAPPRITALCEEASGAVWVGTQGQGLARLTETGSRSFRRNQGLLDDDVACLAVDAEGRLWIGTHLGLNRWDGNQFTAFTKRDGLADESVTGVHVARSGAVWITTRSGMYQIQGGHITPYAFQTESQGRSPEFLGAYEDRRGNLWAFGDTYLINLTEGKRFNYFRGAEAAAVRIWSLCEGRDGRLWIGTSGRGLFCFDDNRFQPVTLHELDRPNDVRAIHEDREGSLWMGTSDSGLVQLLPQPGRVLRAGQGLPADRAICLAADATGRTFIGSESSGVLGSEGGRFEHLAGGGLESQGFVSSLGAAPDGTLWIGTLGAGLHGVRHGRRIELTTFNGLSDNAVLAVCATADGTVWASTRAGILHE
ncbi:MAG TPA: two-component regulator propeller domain-containing protein, partial [Verrucomicrobiae bacterium]